jgi:sensor c-di-GMP phosphodiesterase-like protein
MNTFKLLGGTAFLSGIVLITALLSGALCIPFPSAAAGGHVSQAQAVRDAPEVRVSGAGFLSADPSQLLAQLSTLDIAMTAMPEHHPPYPSSKASNPSNLSNLSISESMRMRPWSWLLAGLAGGLAVSAWLGLLMVRRLSPLGQLSDAVRRHQFIVAYQPIVDLSTRRCIGAEALVRWKHQNRIVRPDHFIPLAEHRGLIQAITDQVFDTVLFELGEFLQRYRELYVSINLSAPDLVTRRFLDRLTPALAEAGIAPQQIRIEATERCFLDAVAAKEVIQAFRDAGHPVYIDDFGTGYSSLSHLQNFQVDALKIDKSFVDTVGQDAASSSVASHIVDMAQTLGVQVIAEGIEREEQACYLQARGAQFGQGWLFSEPLTAPDFVRYVGRGLVTV